MPLRPIVRAASARADRWAAVNGEESTDAILARRVWQPGPTGSSYGNAGPYDSRMSYTIKNLRDVEDIAPRFGLDSVQEARFPWRALEAQQTGLAYHRIKPGQRGFAHRHEKAEEIYVVLAGTGRANLDGEIVELKPLDAIRVAPPVARAFEAGADGLELLVFGPHHADDHKMTNEDPW
jgi:quercetin dioxygenase-like cupin family protein